ncbi:MAG: rRNA maturation RNase YbeY [Bacteriovoracaceae bacterium]|jgi:probable rRNA maturation factor|nr:rRNA maturation RNase YbeY [Bacteriovoracaceae bacterium]
MYNSVIRKGKISLFLSDLARIPCVKTDKKLKKNLTAALEIVKSLLDGNITKEIKVNKSIQLSLTMCGNARIKSLNRDFRQKNKVTDVLSFPMHESMRKNKVESYVNMLETLNLGDIVISKDIAKKQATEFNITYEQEVIHLFVHGILHLLGFDHEVSSEEEKIMEELEKKMVKKIYKSLD